MMNSSNQAKSNGPLKALIVDDEEKIRTTLADVLEDEGWQSSLAENGKIAVQLISKLDFDLILLDVWMPVMDGIEALQKIKQINPMVPVVIMSGHGSIETAVKATKMGAFDYLEKPLSLDKIYPLLEHAVAISRLRGEDKLRQTGGVELIGNCPQIVQIKRQIQMVAPRNAWILITGENGTGKEVVARIIHERSSRNQKPFVAVNCAAIPDELIESELFGHVKGAFTNAISNKKGKFEAAHQGTLFLDEIGDMSLRTQAKILRILQEQQFEKLGSTETVHVDVRVIAATNKDLKLAIKNGQFREDLFYRLNVVPFHLPPLSERGDDVVELAEYFLDKISKELGERTKLLDGFAKSSLKEYSWPGNIRELKNLLERLCIISDSEVVDDNHLRELLGLDIKADSVSFLDQNIGSASLKQAKSDFEKAYILSKLEEYQWNITKTADAIGIERSNLHRKMKLYGLEQKTKG